MIGQLILTSYYHRIYSDRVYCIDPLLLFHLSRFEVAALVMKKKRIPFDSSRNTVYFSRTYDDHQHIEKKIDYNGHLFTRGRPFHFSIFFAQHKIHAKQLSQTLQTGCVIALTFDAYFSSSPAFFTYFFLPSILLAIYLFAR